MKFGRFGAILAGSLLLPATVHCWDRFANETEVAVATGVNATALMRYTFSLSAGANVDLYTDQLTPGGDTYVHVWDVANNRQVAYNDDAAVPGGNSLASRVTTWLPAGTYTVFVRSYSSTSTGTANLYYNGSLVLSNAKFGGTKISLSGRGVLRGDRIRTFGLPSGTDTYILYLDASGRLAGWDDDAGGSLSSQLEVPLNGDGTVVVGAYNPGTEGAVSLGWTPDAHWEFTSLCGPEQRNVESGASFTSAVGVSITSFFPLQISILNNHNPALTTSGDAHDYLFQSQRLSGTDWGIDNFDLVWIHSHGNVGGTLAMRDAGSVIDIAAPTSAVGSGDRTNNRVGKLAYLAVLSCETVRIEHTQSWDWLTNSGWASTATQKGLFEGLHMVVGYHSDHSNTSDSYKYEGSTFGGKVAGGEGIWQAWWETNEATSDEYSGWFSSFSPGMASAIAVTAKAGENINDRRSADIKYGDAGYLFTVSWYGTGDTPPN